MLGKWSTGNGRRQERERGVVARWACTGPDASDACDKPRLAVVPTMGRCSRPMGEALGSGILPLFDVSKIGIKTSKEK